MILQPMNCVVLVPANAMPPLTWEGLTSCLVFKKKDLQSTDRLTQKKYPIQWEKAVCTGGKSSLKSSYCCSPDLVENGWLSAAI